MLLFLFLVSSVLNRVSDNLSSVKSVECKFSEVLMFQGDTLKFSGNVYALRDRARIDVFEPEREVMIFHEDSVFVWREETAQVFRREAPMVFYEILFSPAKSYKVSSKNSDWVNLSPIENNISYPLSVKFNNNLLPAKMRFYQETGAGEFTFTSYKLNQTYDEQFFSFDSFLADK
jgi:outer membrane lipoprotein-sorting protein